MNNKTPLEKDKIFIETKIKASRDTKEIINLKEKLKEITKNILLNKD